jgi:ribonuclease-3
MNDIYSMNNHNPCLSEIEKIIGYQFNDKQLGISAITTRAYSNEHPECPDNQALEFLGDAILSFITAELLYEKWSHLKDNKALHEMTPEFVMTKIRQEVVNNQYLRSCANSHNLCDFIFDSTNNQNAVNNNSGTGPGDDIIEALIAAIYFDAEQSIARAKNFVMNFLNLSDLLNDEKRIIELVTKKNLKDRLIHKYQELKKVTPSIEYPVIEDRITGNMHYFVLGLQIDGKLLPGITGSGPNKALAEYGAVYKAYQFLEKIEWDLTRIQ